MPNQLSIQLSHVLASRPGPPRARRFAQCAPPDDTWCADFKGHFALGDKSRCHPLTLTDQASRYLLKCEGVAKPDEASVRPHFERAFREFGLPHRIRSDNGPPFATPGVGGLSALSVSWIKLGIHPERIEPGKPQQNGRHERMLRELTPDREERLVCTATAGSGSCIDPGGPRTCGERVASTRIRSLSTRHARRARHRTAGTSGRFARRPVATVIPEFVRRGT
ncbi:DDE-type integrase/transposase/recombinase [Sorangium sp. So ce128]